MFRYTLEDKVLTKVEVESDKTVKDLQSRSYTVPATNYDYDYYRYAGYYGGYRGYRKRRNRENSLFDKGLGTKSFTPSLSTKWDSTRKCFVWKHDNSPYKIYDASNVRLTNRGYYLSEFDIDKLPVSKNPKLNKKKYALLNKYMDSLFKESKYWDDKAVEDQTMDFTKEDRLNEFRALWLIRHLLTKAFKAGKRISPNTLNEMFVKTKYTSKIPNETYTFGKYVRENGESLVDYLTAETDKLGQ